MDDEHGSTANIPRLSLQELLMLVALCAIICTFGISEGCGVRRTRIGDLAFSRDGRLLAVARYDAREGGELNCLSNRFSNSRNFNALSRTVIVYDAPSLDLYRVVEQKHLTGDYGPATHVFQFAGCAIGFCGDPEHLAIAGYGGGDGDVLMYPLTESSSQSDARVIGTGSFLRSIQGDDEVAVGSREGIAVLSAETDSVPSRLPTVGGFLGFIDLSADGNKLAVNGLGQVEVWDTHRQSMSFAVNKSNDMGWVVGTRLSPDGEMLAVVFRTEVRLYDNNGQELYRTGTEENVRAAAFSPNGSELCVAVGTQLRVRDTATGALVKTFEHDADVSCVEYSPDGACIACGDQEGRVTIRDVADGHIVASTVARGGWRPPWTLPALALVTWYVTFRKLRKRHTKMQ